MADSNRPRARKPKGFRDAFSEDCLRRQQMLETICEVYRRFGFRQLETPCIEYVDALGKFLPEADQPDAGVFAMKDDQDDKWLALRYDLTAPLARTVAEYGDNLPSPFRRYQFGPVWRRERKPGKDRFREFFQCDFDTVGSESMAADAEVCLVLGEAMRALGIDDFVIRVNNRKVLNGLLESLSISDPAVRLDILRTLDKLDDIGIRGVQEQLGPGRKDKSGSFNDGLNLPDSAIERVVNFLQCRKDSRQETCLAFEEIAQSGGAEGVEELRQMDQFLEVSGIDQQSVRFDPSLVRGLEYYTGPVFEIELPFEIKVKGKPKKFGSVAGGGRYDYLVERFTGRKVPATGASIGVDRLLTALQLLNESHETDAARPGPVIVTVMDTNLILEYQKMANELRAAGIDAELYMGDRKFKAQMKYADKRNAPAAIIVGSDEFEAGNVTIKNMGLGSQLAKEVQDNEAWRKGQPAQSTVARESLVSTVAQIVSEIKD